MKILICGAFSAGKTEVVNQIGKCLDHDLHKISVVEEVARKAPFALNKDQAFDTTSWLYCQQISTEIAATKSGADIIICDRGIPDIYSHYLDILEAQTEGNVFLEAFFPGLKEWCTTYDNVFFCPVNHGIPIQADSVRVADPAYRQKMERHFYEALQALEIPYVKLPYDKEERTAMVLKSMVDRL